MRTHQTEYEDDIVSLKSARPLTPPGSESQVTVPDLATYHYQVLNRKTRSRSQEEWKVAGRSGKEVISRGWPHAPQAHTDYELDRSNTLRKQFTIDFRFLVKPSRQPQADCRTDFSHWLALNRITEWSCELLHLMLWSPLHCQILTWIVSPTFSAHVQYPILSAP